MYCLRVMTTSGAILVYVYDNKEDCYKTLEILKDDGCKIENSEIIKVLNK